MIVTVTALSSDYYFRDPVGAPLFRDVRPLHREAGRLDFRFGGRLSRWIDEGAVDPDSPTPTLFTPGGGGAFPQVVLAGAGSYRDLTPPSAEKVTAGMVETFIRAKASIFSIASRDFRRANTSPRDSADTIMRGLAHGCDLANVHEGSEIRVLWDANEVDKLVSELKRCRHHFPACKDWKISRASEDYEVLGLDQVPTTSERE